MSTAPVITIFVRHSADCKYNGDEFCKRCNCRKHFRWFQNGEQYRRKAGTRSWAEAEDLKRKLEDQLAGRMPTAAESEQGQTFAAALKAFLTEKEVTDVGRDRRGKYQTELDRFTAFCEGNGVLVLQRVTPDLVNAYKKTWPARYPSTYSQDSVQKRLKCFLSFCVYRRWLDRVPKLAPVKITEPPTEPLTEDEYKAVLAAATDTKQSAVIQLMRWSGLAVRDASGLRRDEVTKHTGYYSIQRVRQKILATKGSNRAAVVYIPIPEHIGKLLDSVANGNPEYIFWEKAKGKTLQNYAHNMSNRISDVFDAAGVPSAGNLVSHRLRDMYAVDLLTKGVPLDEVSKLLGHSSVKTTEKHYASWIKGRQDRLDDLVMATWAEKKP
jgi:integrase/recombinase XerD